MIQLVYRCRLCRQDEMRVSDLLDGLERKAFDHVLTDMTQTIVHACTESDSHLGLCDLAGVIVAADEQPRVL